MILDRTIIAFEVLITGTYSIKVFSIIDKMLENWLRWLGHVSRRK